MGRAIPHFVFVGPKRTGTTWINAYLEAHPDVFLPAVVKETFFFDRFYDYGHEWHRSLFDLPSSLPRDARVGEVSPSYFHSQAAANRLWESTPGCRIIITLRHPYRRLISLYYHHQQAGTVPGSMSLADALRARPFLLESSRYGTYTAGWLDRFGRDQVSVLFQDDLTTDPPRFAAAVCDAIRVRTVPFPDALEKRVGRGGLPRSFAVSRMAQRSVGWLRERGWFGVIRLGGRLGLRGLLMEGRPLPAEDPAIPSWAKGVLRAEVRRLQSIGIDTPDWEL